MNEMTERFYNILYSDYAGSSDAELPDEGQIERLLKIARRHRLTELFLKATAKASAERRFEYQAFAIRQYQREWEMREELNSVLRELEASGIRYTMIKGFFFTQAYPEPGLRALKDADIIIDDESMERITELLKARGYLPMPKAKMDQSFVKPGFLELEIHYKFWDDVWLSNRNIKKWKAVWTPTEYVVENLRYNGMPVEDEILNWMLHLKKHFICGSANMRFLFDILYASRRYQVDWDKVREKAAQTGVLKLFEITRAFCRDGSPDSPEARALIEAVAGYNWGPECMYPQMSLVRLLRLPVIGRALTFTKETVRGLFRRRGSFTQCVKAAAASAAMFSKYSAAGKRAGLDLS